MIGLCWASSQDFATCTFTETAGIITDGSCTYDKVAEEDKKPDSQDTWGMIEPQCAPTLCAPTKNEIGMGQDWFMRITRNTRSCNGAWGQTFVYKEAIAYWAGSAPNLETGVSGHVALFVNTAATEGTYDRAQTLSGNPMTVDDTDKTAAGCTGNGDSGGLIDRGLPKP